MNSNLVELNGKLLLFTAPNTEEITIPSKGHAQTMLDIPKLQGKYIVGVTIIGARTTSYVAQVFVAGFSRLGINDTKVYIDLYNAYETSLSNAFQLGIWYIEAP